jgi:hypothetical protein
MKKKGSLWCDNNIFRKNGEFTSAGRLCRDNDSEMNTVEAVYFERKAGK